MTAAVRCTAPHPTVRGWECRAKLTEAVEGSVDIRPGNELTAGCVLLRCERCGTEYIACLTDSQKGAA